MDLPVLLKSANHQTGMALMPLVLTVVIAGAMIGVGMHVVEPMAKRMRVQATANRINDASRSVIAWSVDRGRLPTAAEFTVAAGVRDDLWHRGLVYVYDGSLAAASQGGLCGRTSTGMTANGSADTAFLIFSGGPDFTIDSTPKASGAYGGNAAISGLDLGNAVSLADLRNRAGCFDRTAGRLTLLNNELPAGCSGKPYSGGLFSQGGVAPHSWTTGTLPDWLTLTPAGSVVHCTGTPSSPGIHRVDVTLSDAAGDVVQRRFDISVAACGPAPVSNWKLDEGSGTTAADGTGDNHGTLYGDAAWTTDTPDGSGSALVFDGSGDHLHVSDHASLHLTGELTLMAWAKETSTGRYAKIVSRRTGYYFYFLGVDNGHPYGGIGDDVTYTVTGKSLLMSLDRWNHLTMVYNDAADRMLLHFDGTERMTTGTRSLPVHVGVDLSLGADEQGTQGYFNGDIDDVAVYDRALTDNEIRGLMHGAAHPNRVVSYGFNGNADDGGPGGHDGMVVGATYTTDRFGAENAALRLDGDDTVLVADHPDLQLTGQLTLAAWIRERTPGRSAQIISRRSGNHFYFLGVDNGRPYGGIGDGTGYTVTRKSIAMLPDQWHFVAFVYDDATDRFQIYFNGTLDETFVPVSLPPMTGVDLTIGADYQGTHHFFTGSIDEVAVYDQTLTVEEIRAAY
ncbi:MAG: hypothetical protein CR984_07175 [Proteobacteria bacterium]|nr:MAG: hypothetical protein CR984_07175 [Pseudomonadota bacterium]